MKSSLESRALRGRTSRSGERELRLMSRVAAFLGVGYLLILCCPQVLFAHQVVYRRYTVCSTGTIDPGLTVVLDRVDSLLATSPIADRALRPRIVLFDRPGGYAALSLFHGGRSFGKSFVALPPDNVFINAHDVAHDLVFRGAAENDVRSLSGVIAHEVTHLLVRRKFGYWRNLAFPAWKKEGYAEYVAGGSTLPYETGVRMWRARPEDSTGYRYFQYSMVVKYLLEHEGLTAEALFDREIDFEATAHVVWKSLMNGNAVEGSPPAADRSSDS